MSYCRIGDDSDVYLIATGDGFSLWLRAKDGVDYPAMPVHLHGRSRRDCLELVTLLRRFGLKVPRRATNRLRREIRGDSSNG